MIKLPNIAGTETLGLSLYLTVMLCQRHLRDVSQFSVMSTTHHLTHNRRWDVLLGHDFYVNRHLILSRLFKCHN